MQTNVTMHHAFHLYSGSGSNAYKFQDPGTSRYEPWAERSATASAATLSTASASGTAATAATATAADATTAVARRPCLACSLGTPHALLTHSSRTHNPPLTRLISIGLHAEYDNGTDLDVVDGFEWFVEAGELVQSVRLAPKGLALPDDYDNAFDMSLDDIDIQR